MATSMRGLTQVRLPSPPLIVAHGQYISDLRACRVRELEEKRINREMAHIRQKFKEGNLDGYQRKKYLAKVVFTYILGYKVDVGHMEAVNLISSPKYSEKQIVSRSRYVWVLRKALTTDVGARGSARSRAVNEPTRATMIPVMETNI